MEKAKREMKENVLFALPPYSAPPGQFGGLGGRTEEWAASQLPKSANVKSALRCLTGGREEVPHSAQAESYLDQAFDIRCSLWSLLPFFFVGFLSFLVVHCSYIPMNWI